MTVTAFQTTINTWDNTHQDPVLTTTSDVDTLTYNAAAGQWTEFLYTAGRPYPTILASAQHTATLPTMHFYAGGIPNGRYQVIANLYDNAPMRYYFGYTSADPSALNVVTAGSATGTEHREYSLGTVDITNNAFNLYTNKATQLGGNYEMFGWAWIRLAPADHLLHLRILQSIFTKITIRIQCWQRLLHDEPGGLTSNSTNHLWTEFLYTTSRPLPIGHGQCIAHSGAAHDALLQHRYPERPISGLC